MKKLILFFLVIVSIKGFTQNCPCPNGQTCYYVKPAVLGGNNNANGTSFQTAWATIQHAANTATPGSTVYISQGTYDELVTINVNGTENNPITFTNCGNDIVTITKTGIQPNGSSLISIVNRSNIIIQGLILDNLIGQDVRGVYVSSNQNNGLSNITLRYLKVRNIKYTNQNNPIPNDSDQAHAIQIVGRGDNSNSKIHNIRINDCEINNNITGWAESVTITGNVEEFYILNNFIHDNSNIGIVAAGNYQYHNYNIPETLNHARIGTISNNTVINNRTPSANIPANAGIYCDGCWNTTIEKNQSFNNKIGISIGCEIANGTTQDVVVKNNIIYNNDFEGIQFGASNAGSGTVINSKVLNNTCLKNDSNNTTRGEIKITKVQNCEILQNIFYCNNNFLFYVEPNLTPQTYTMNYNCFYSEQFDADLALVNYFYNTNYSYNYYLSIVNQNANSIFSNPQLTNTNLNSPDFHLLSNSPCINAGNPIFVTSNGETDYYGNPRINMTYIDIGADEYQAPLFINQNIKSTFKMIPNPSNNNLIITFGNQTDSEGILKIHDLMGKHFFEKNITNEIQIDISNYQSGIYIVSFESKNIIDIQKLIIKH